MLSTGIGYILAQIAFNFVPKGLIDLVTKGTNSYDTYVRFCGLSCI